MGFWSGLGKGLKAIGKGALKVAPIAANFIPGVGPLAAMGIGAATGALSNKMGGGSFLGGALGGAAQGGMGALGKAALFGKGLNPSGGFLSKMGKAGFANKFGRSVMGAMSGSPIRRGYGTPPFVPSPAYAGGGGFMGGRPLTNAYGGNQFAQSVANNSRAFTMGY